MPVKIVHIVKATGIHGTEKHLLELLPRLTNRYAIEIIVLVEPHIPLDDYCALLRARGLSTHLLRIARHVDPFCLLALTALLRRMQPAIVHTHLLHGDLYGSAAAACAGVRTVISTRHNDDSFREQPLIKLANRLLARRAVRIIAISDWVARFISRVENAAPEKLTTIHYGMAPPVPVRQPNDVRAELGYGPGQCLLGIIARLVPQKGHACLLEAFAGLQRDCPETRLVIVGDGPEYAALRAQADRLGIADSVCFTGYRGDAADVLGAIDIFVHPSLWEGFGLAILEAMHMARPIVATRVSAIPELIEHGDSGILVPPSDPARLTQALQTVCRDAQLRSSLGARACERAQQHFSVERMSRATLALYDEVLETQDRP